MWYKQERLRAHLVVLASGAYDGLHAGHVAHLETAKALCREGEPLVVGVAPDAYIEVTKGRAAYWPQADRARTIRALQIVDAVIAHGSPSVAEVIAAYHPRVVVKGSDWRGRLPVDVAEACREVGAEIVYTETPGIHVSDARRGEDEAALARFERVVLGQRQLTTPWRPVTDYSYEARKASEGTHPELIWRHLIHDDDDVLDYGCGPDGHLVRLLREYQVAHRPDSQVCIVGYDPQVETGRYPGLINDPPKCARTWDVVICREVLEHCPICTIRQLVTLLCGLSSRYVYVTTRFTRTPSHLLSVDTSDDLDPTHISMLHPTLLRVLCVLEGFRRRMDLEEKLDWQRKGRCLVYERAVSSEVPSA